MQGMLQYRSGLMQLVDTTEFTIPYSGIPKSPPFTISFLISSGNIGPFLVPRLMLSLPLKSSISSPSFRDITTIFLNSISSLQIFNANIGAPVLEAS